MTGHYFLIKNQDMRRFSLVVFVTLITMTTVNAQKFRAGVHTGVDIASFRIAGASGGPLKDKTALTGGLSFEAKVSPIFSVQLEANYSQQGTGLITPDASTAGSYNLSYVTIPLLAKLSATKNLSFYAGPQVGILLSAKVLSSTAPKQDVKDQLESTDFYAVLGTQYRFDNGVFVDARYNLGTQGLAKDAVGGANFKNQYLSFRIGYSFSFGK
jgi:hypothetical protein